MKILALELVLTGKWFDMTASHEKKEEYRDITPYWVKRIVNTGGPTAYLSYFNEEELIELANEDGFWQFTHVRLHRGYTNTTLLIPIESISIGYGRPEWGAPKDRKVFIIKYDFYKI